MKKFFKRLEEVIPMIWAIAWFIIITVGSISLAVWVVLWLLRLLGVL